MQHWFLSNDRTGRENERDGGQLKRAQARKKVGDCTVKSKLFFLSLSRERFFFCRQCYCITFHSAFEVHWLSFFFLRCMKPTPAVDSCDGKTVTFIIQIICLMHKVLEGKIMSMKKLGSWIEHEFNEKKKKKFSDCHKNACEKKLTRKLMVVWKMLGFS